MRKIKIEEEQRKEMGIPVFSFFKEKGSCRKSAMLFAKIYYHTDL